MENLNNTEVAMDWKTAVTALERRNRRLSRWLYALTLLWSGSIILTLLTGTSPLHAAQSSNANVATTDKNGILRVHGLVIVDNRGTERVWIGGAIPDALEFGKRHLRSGSAAGILLLDEEGNERSGYLTSTGSGEVFLSLDTLTQQSALFLANADTGVHLDLYDEFNDSAMLAAHHQLPNVRLKKNGTVVLEVPNKETGTHE